MTNTSNLTKIRQNQLDSIRENQLQEFFDTTDRYIEIIIDFLFRLPSTESKADIVLLRAAIASLGASTVNHLETARLSLRAGLLQPAIILFRAAFEAALLIDYLATYPKEAIRWTQGKGIKMSTVRKGLTNLVGASEIYSNLSEMVHPNLASVRPIVFNINTTDKTSLGIVVGGVSNDNQIFIYGQTYIATCLFVTTVFLSNAAIQLGPLNLWEDLVKRKSELDQWTIDKWPQLTQRVKQ